MRPVDLAAILKALQDRFQLHTLKTKVSGMYAYAAPQGAPFPYIVVTFQTVNPWDCLSDGASGESVIVQFSIFSKTYPNVQQAVALTEDLTDCFDEADLSVEGYTHLRMERLGGMYPVAHPDTGIFHAPVRYRLSVQKAQ